MKFHVDVENCNNGRRKKKQLFIITKVESLIKFQIYVPIKNRFRKLKDEIIHRGPHAKTLDDKDLFLKFHVKN